ncbi:MAG: hypothetical protein H7Y30_00330 [Pyrinomonadaceae bacterium]|nr:hypothetical protein [Pyrinomonadaceae bacterium]
MSTETTQNNAQTAPPPAVEADAPASAPKQLAGGRTVCNERNEKKKLCNGHLKQLRTGGEEAEKHLSGDDALFKCQTCGTLYIGPPLGHLRDPDKQSRFVEKELAALLQAAGGTLPSIVKNEKGAYVLAEEAKAHAPAAAAKPAAAKAAPTAQTPAAAQSPAAKPAGAKGSHIKVGHIPGADGPVPGETFEQKIARLKAVSAEAKRRAEAREAAEAAGETLHTEPAAASTSGTDSSAEADRHRPAAEAQAATGMASAAPLSPAAATASPVAGAETAADLAPDTVEPAAAQTASPPIPGADGPVPGETFEEKIERLKRVVAGARERAIREGKREG